MTFWARVVGFVATVLVVCAAASGAARADYPKRNLDVIVPFSAGGGFDLFARAVARSMERQFGQGINLVPRNVAGAGGIRGLATLYRAAPDGYTFGIVPIPGAVQPVLLGQKVEYDLDKMTWLGVVSIGRYALVVGKASPFQTLEAFLRGTPRLPFVASPGGNDFAMTKIILGTLKSEAKYLSSFPGAPEAQLATVRGEADAALGIEETIDRSLASGDLKPILSLRRKTAERFPGVPTVDDIGHPELANLALYRLFAAPPGLDPDVRSKLIATFQAAIRDPDFIAWSEKTRSPIDAGTPEDAVRFYKTQKELLSKHIELLKPESQTQAK